MLWCVRSHAQNAPCQLLLTTAVSSWLARRVRTAVGDSTCGQRAVYQLGMTQIPVINVNNNCRCAGISHIFLLCSGHGLPGDAIPKLCESSARSTGSTALYTIRQAIQGGLIDCGMALGFEKMSPGPLGAKAVWTDRQPPLGKMMKTMEKQRYSVADAE